MQTKIKIVLLMLLKCSISYAQSDCSTAVEDQGLNTIMMAPIGSVAPIGPDYGCISILSRPAFGYFISCDTTTIQPIFLPTTSIDTYFSIVIWGPFKDKNYACNNLTSANIYHCEDSIHVNGSWFNISTVIDAQPGELYYYMIATTESSAPVGLTPAHNIIQSVVGPSIPYKCYTCNNEVSHLLRRDFCLVSVDPVTQKTQLVWEKVPDSGVDGYVIWRGVQGQPSYTSDSVAYVSNSLPSEFTDFDSHPMQYGEYYSLQPVDSCGNSNTFWTLAYNKVCFLQTTSGGNNIVNLNWNSFILSYATPDFESVQYIHRGFDAFTMQIIDTIPLGVVSYTDITAPAGQNYYSIERRRFSACNPLRTTSTNYLGSFSNPSSITVTGLPVTNDEIMISVGPVPANDFLTVKIDKSFFGNKIELVDLSGKTVTTDFVSSTSETIDVSGLSAGTYWLCVSGKTKLVKKIIIEK